MDAMTVYMAETSSLSNPVEVDDKGLPGHGLVTCDCFVSERGLLAGGLLMERCLSRASDGSIGPSCLAQWTSSPEGLDFVHGREKTLVWRPL